jgi:hypothetical protein
MRRTISSDELAREVIRATTKAATRPKPNFLGSIGEANYDPDDPLTKAFPNPMSAPGDIIVGGVGGGAARRAIGTEGQVLTVVDVGGILVPMWADSTGGGGGGGPATGQYRQYVLIADGSGGFDFVDDGSGNPVQTLEDLE